MATRTRKRKRRHSATKSATTPPKRKRVRVVKATPKKKPTKKPKRIKFNAKKDSVCPVDPDTTKLYTQEWLDKKYNEGYEKGFKESLDSLHRIELWQVLVIYFIGIVGGFAIRGIWQ